MIMIIINLKGEKFVMKYLLKGKYFASITNIVDNYFIIR